MKQIIQQISYKSLLTIMALLLFSSCLVDEREPYPDDPEIWERDGSEVLFSLQVPSASYTRGATKSLPDEDKDLEVKDFQVLVFDPTTDKYLYTAYTSKVITDDEDPATKTITVKLLDGLLEDNTYDLLFLANARSILQTLHPGGISRDLSKEEVLETLCYQNTGRFITSSDGTFTSIPMWGKRDRVRLEQSDLTTNSVKMVRSVAKVNLGIGDEAFQNFTLQSVHVYNYIPGGYLAPLSNEWTGDDSIETPYIPSLLQPVKTPLLYTEVTGGKKIQDMIYLFEAAKGSSATLLDNICLVVGGSYKGGAPTYYRLDFIEKSGAYTSLLRNYCYEVVVTSINGPGYSTPDEAFRAGPFDMKVEILNWCEGDMKEFVIDGQYLISLSQGEFTFSREERHEYSTDNKLTIYTNYPEGWYVLKSSIIDDETGTTPDWLELSAGGLTVSGDTLKWGQTTKKQLTLLVDEYTSLNPLGRSGSFTIRAGRLNYKVKVEQTSEAGSNVNIYILNSEGAEINYLEFPGNSTDPKEMILTWSPALVNQFVTVIDIKDKSQEYKFPFRVPVFTIGQEIYGFPNPGSRTFTITPEMMTDNSDPFRENSTTVRFEIEYGTKKVEKDFTFLQVNRGIKVLAEESYPSDGGTHSFTIQSNTAWKGELAHGGGAVEELLTTSGGNAPAGEPVYFTTINYEGEETRTAEFWFTSYTNEFDTVKVFVNFYGKFILTANNASSYKADGSSYSFTVTANQDWTVTRTGSGINSHSPTSGKAGNTLFTFITQDLSSATTATIHFTSGTQTVPVTISQTPNNFTLTTSGMAADYEAEGDSYRFQVTANRNWTASILQDAGHIAGITPNGNSGTSDFVFQTAINGTAGSSVIRFSYTNGVVIEYVDVTINFRATEKFILTHNILSEGYQTFPGISSPYSFTVKANKPWTLDLNSTKAPQITITPSSISGEPGETTINFRTTGTDRNVDNILEFVSGSQTERVIIKTLRASFNWSHSGVAESYKADGSSYSFEMHFEYSSFLSVEEIWNDRNGFIKSATRGEMKRGGLYGRDGFYCTVTFETNIVNKSGQAMILWSNSLTNISVTLNFNP